MDSIMNDKKHFYMATVQLSYVKYTSNEMLAGDGTIYETVEFTNHQRTMNIVIESNVKRITYADINRARQACLGRLEQENNITPENVRDVVFVNISHLGLMSQTEFQGTPKESH